MKVALNAAHAAGPATIAGIVFDHANDTLRLTWGLGQA
jgi:hypothetical protein